MVNKCSMTGCESLYTDSKVKLHRFPLANPTTLPLWIAATNKEEHWTPTKSSRLCGNHFLDAQYDVGYGKSVLKMMAIPIINIGKTYRKNKNKLNNPRPTKDNEQTISPLEDYLTLEIDQMSFAQFCQLKEYQLSIQNTKSCDDRVEPDKNNLDGSGKTNNNDNGTKTRCVKIRRIRNYKNRCLKKTVKVSKPPDNGSHVELSRMSYDAKTAVLNSRRSKRLTSN